MVARAPSSRSASARSAGPKADSSGSPRACVAKDVLAAAVGVAKGVALGAGVGVQRPCQLGNPHRLAQRPGGPHLLDRHAFVGQRRLDAVEQEANRVAADQLLGSHLPAPVEGDRDEAGRRPAQPQRVAAAGRLEAEPECLPQGVGLVGDGEQRTRLGGRQLTARRVGR